MPKLAAVSADDALEAARTLSEDKRTKMQRYADTSAVGAVASPLVDVTGRATKAFGDAQRGARMSSALHAIRGTSKGDIAKSMTQGILAAGAVQAAREGVSARRAKDTFHKFMQQEQS